MSIDYDGAEASAFIHEVWEKKAQDAFTAGLVISKPDVITYVSTEKTRGDIVHIATMPLLTAANVTVATGALTVQDSTVTDTSVTINKWKAVPVEVTDEVMMKAYLDVMAKFSEQFGGVLGGAIDTDVLAQHGSLTSNNVGDESNPERMSLDMALVASLKLDDGNVPQSKRTWILSPVGKSHLVGDANFKNAMNTGLNKGTMITGELPDILGYKALVTTSVATSGSLRKNLLIHVDCFAAAVHHRLIIEKLAKGATGAAPALAQVIVGTAMYGVGVPRQAAGCVINTRTTF